MTDRDYAIKSMKEITFQMASHAQDYLEVTIERHYTDIKELMTSYQKLILENQIVLEELDMECQEKRPMVVLRSQPRRRSSWKHPREP